MKQVYFACSIRGGRADQPTYQEIMSLIKVHAAVVSEIFVDKTQTGRNSGLTDHQIWKRDVAWLEKSDAIIAEATTPSLGVGYEIAQAEALKKPILVLYRTGTDHKLSAMIAGSPKVQVVSYRQAADLDGPIAKFIRSL